MTKKDKKNIFDNYEKYLHALKIKIPAKYWITFVVLVAIILGMLGFFIDTKVGILLFVVIADLGIGIPIYSYDNHIKQIEKYWPEALKLVADTMKAGSSFDYALREVTVADFGPVSFEVNEVIRRIEMGDSTQDALNYLSRNVDSKTVKRTVTLIKESLKSGAQLAEVLEQIADDTKKLFRIKKERKTKTMLQTIFIVAAGGIIAPFIFGMAKVITEFLGKVAQESGIATGSALAVSLEAQAAIFLVLDIYIVIESFAATGIISLMREGKLTYVFVYFPAMVTVAYIVYYISQFVLSKMLEGMV